MVNPTGLKGLINICLIMSRGISVTLASSICSLETQRSTFGMIACFFRELQYSCSGGGFQFHLDAEDDACDYSLLPTEASSVITDNPNNKSASAWNDCR